MKVAVKIGTRRGLVEFFLDSGIGVDVKLMKSVWACHLVW